MGPLGEDVEDELRAIDDTKIRHLSDASDLRWSEILVDNEKRRAVLECGNHDLLQLAAPDQKFRMSLRRPLHHAIDHSDTGRFGEFGQFGETGFLFRAASWACAH